ncbi:hypothetical protein [Nocardia australiensis]|uniref:hypothetical protein n=1 Tax=Nocardia australiensis TaxID=2887191 RepID=UPI001D133528|nr:hypothetical protein [Nocardia australiensis]
MIEWAGVTLRQEIRTPVGIMPRGSEQVATPFDAGWLVRVTDAHLMLVPERTIYAGAKRRQALEDKAAAHEEYVHAREVLGYSHAAAMRWLIESYGITERTLFRWGFTDVHAPRAVAS